eukprot:CAMPEP_0179424120 /NCGR_PEP_ID=MMETSP0799-20121207/11400_1 /TAXON_ID=46947 /ORGANISM="Geminigera cryophila, Strain CCMP2564" /LENGTH=116 /DNA_ID=CAMNT_0021198513 /DNA_START=200 /DNA_END=550 /DNA_ORIENTATION=+
MAEMISKTPAECHKLIQEGYAYVDVRTPDEFAGAHSPGAVNIPAFALPGLTPLQDEFLAKITATYPDKTQKMILACASGRRSALAVPWLLAAGYPTVVDMAKGWGGWMEAALPVDK